MGDGVDDLGGEVVLGALERVGQVGPGVDQGEQVVDPGAVPPEQVVDPGDVQPGPPGQLDALVGPGLEPVGADERHPVGDRVADRQCRAVLSECAGGVDGVAPPSPGTS